MHFFGIREQEKSHYPEMEDWHYEDDYDERNGLMLCRGESQYVP
jgi:hypothetical protein